MGAAQGSAMDDALGTGPAEDEVDCQGKCPAFLQRAGMLKRSSLAKTTVSVTCVGIGFGVSLMMLIMICAFSNCWWPMMTFLVYIMTPIPMTFMMASCGRQGSDPSALEEGGSNNAWFKRIMAEFGTCLSGMLFSTLLGLPITLMHNNVGEMGKDNWWVGMVWIFANILVMLSLMVAVVTIRAPAGASSY